MAERAKRRSESGDAVTALEKVFGALKIPLSHARLADFTERDFGMKMGYLEAWLDRNSDTPVISAFVIGLPESVIIDEGRRGQYRVPIVSNLADHGVVVWIEGEADNYLYEGLIHGFRFRTTSIIERGCDAVEASKHCRHRLDLQGLAPLYP
jgi:hypothetical protein